jgi:hypothetical protein
VHLDEDIQPRRPPPGQKGHHSAIPIARGFAGTPPLDRVCRVEADRGERPHLDQTAHVDDQVVVAEGGSSLRDQVPAGPVGKDLLHRVADVEGRHELALLDVHRPPGCGAGNQEIGLPAQEGRDLQAVGHLGGRLCLAGLVDIGHHGDLGLDPRPSQNPQALVEAEPPIGGQARAVGLVDGRLEHDRKVLSLSDLADPAGHRQRHLLRLDDVDTRDQDQRRPIPHRDIANPHGYPPVRSRSR